MAQLDRIVLASNNLNKVHELKQILSPLNIQVISQTEFEVPEIEEPYITFVENALHKARHCSKFTGLPALADDSGLCVPALGGKPGVLSARYAGEPRSHSNNNLKLIRELAPFKDKSAYFYCVLIMVRSANDPQPIIAEGKIDGSIVEIPKGNNGFGYDPYFYLSIFDKTMAELEPEVKNQVSHRARAATELTYKLSQQTKLLK